MELALDARNRAKEAVGFFHRHIEHVADVLALVLDVEGLAIVALAVAVLALDIDVRQEVHLDLDGAVALARLAAAALDVKGEASGVVAAGARLGRLRKELADAGKQVDIGSRIGARGAANRALVDANELVDLLQPRTLSAIKLRIDVACGHKLACKIKARAASTLLSCKALGHDRH